MSNFGQKSNQTKSDSISVAMCTYNGGRYIDAQFESIFNQSKLPNEIIVSDDGSADRTVQHLNEISQRSPIPIRILQGHPQLGVTRNFERAIRACNGNIIVLSDQDDIWHENKIQRMVDEFDVHPDCGYVFSDARLIDSEGGSTGGGLWELVGFTDSRRHCYQTGNQLEVMLRGGNFVYGMSMAFRARYLELVLPISATSEDCTHDTWIATLLSAAGHRGVAISDLLVAYRQHEGQVVGAGQFQASSWRSIQNVLATNKRVASNLADDYGALANRLRMADSNSSSARVLEEKALHLRQRWAAVTASRLPRLSIVISELVSGRYAKYSSSWRSAIRDLAADGL